MYIPDRSTRYNINTTILQSDTLFRIRVRFSDALLVSQKNTMSCLLAVRAFVLSYAIHF